MSLKSLLTFNQILVLMSLISVLTFEVCALKEALTIHTSEAWKNASSALLLLTPSLLRLQDRDPDKENDGEKDSDHRK